MLTRKSRLVLLYFVTGTLLLNLVVSVVRGTPPPDGLYAILASIAGYLLIGDPAKKKTDAELEPGDDHDADPTPDKAPK